MPSAQSTTVVYPQFGRKCRNEKEKHKGRAYILLLSGKPRLILRCCYQDAFCRHAESYCFVDYAAAYRHNLRRAEGAFSSVAYGNKRMVYCAVHPLLSCGFGGKAAVLSPRYGANKNFAFKKLTEKSISSFNGENTAVYISALSNDATSVESEYLTQQFKIIEQIVTFSGAFIMMLLYSLPMTAVAVVLTALPFAASMLTGSRLEGAERRVSEQNAGFVATLKDCLSGFSVVKSFKAEKEIYNLFAKCNAALEGKKFDKQRIKILVGMIGAVTGIFAQLGVFIAGAYFALSGSEITAGIVIAFVNLMNFIIQPIAELPGMLAGRKAAIGLIDKLGHTIEESSANGGTERLGGVSSSIRFTNVSFGYEKESTVLHNISAEFSAGKAYAVVGGSGSGKSTLLGLLTAANTGYSGSITFDGKELRDISSEALYT